MRNAARIGGWIVAGTLLSGCALTPHYYRENGPSTEAAWDSPTAADVKAQYEPAPSQRRDGWPALTVASESGIVYHWPLYFEDPFVDKGDGRTNATHPHNVYRLGWEDWVAFPYGFARFTANWLFLPVSAVVTPPWTVMESDGYLSRQICWRDHDATRSNGAVLTPATPPADEPAYGDEPPPPADETPAETSEHRPEAPEPDGGATMAAR